MNSNGQNPPRPGLIAPRQQQTLEAIRAVGQGFDPDVWHVMDARDNQLIQDQILHGAGSSAFVYSFMLAGTKVTGVSVVGARHLAAHYRGLKHRLVASVQKVGSVFTFTSYPGEYAPMAVNCQVIEELAHEADFYSIIVEMTDVKTGNSIQIERREARFEVRRDGNPYERPNYATIAQSKAFRNAVLSLVPQDLLIRWRDQQLALGKDEKITADVLSEKRANVLRFAAQKAIGLDRHAVEALTLDQIAGLGDAAREGQLPAFVNAAQALDLMGHDERGIPEPAEGSPPQAAQPRRPHRRTRAPGPGEPQGEPEGDPRPEPPPHENEPATPAQGASQAQGNDMFDPLPEESSEGPAPINPQQTPRRDPPVRFDR